MEQCLNFHLIRTWSPSQERSPKINQVSKFEVLSFYCNNVEGFQKSEKLETVLDLGDAISELETFVWNLGDL